MATETLTFQNRVTLPAGTSVSPVYTVPVDTIGLEMDLTIFSLSGNNSLAIIELQRSDDNVDWQRFSVFYSYQSGGRHDVEVPPPMPGFLRLQATTSGQGNVQCDMQMTGIRTF